MRRRVKVFLSRIRSNDDETEEQRECTTSRSSQKKKSPSGHEHLPHRNSSPSPTKAEILLHTNDPNSCLSSDRSAATTSSSSAKRAAVSSNGTLSPSSSSCQATPSESPRPDVDSSTSNHALNVKKDWDETTSKHKGTSQALFVKGRIRVEPSVESASSAALAAYKASTSSSSSNVRDNAPTSQQRSAAQTSLEPCRSQPINVPSKGSTVMPGALVLSSIPSDTDSLGMSAEHTYRTHNHATCTVYKCQFCAQSACGYAWANMRAMQSCTDQSTPPPFSRGASDTSLASSLSTNTDITTMLQSKKGRSDTPTSTNASGSSLSTSVRRRTTLKNDNRVDDQNRDSTDYSHHLQTVTNSPGRQIPDVI